MQKDQSLASHACNLVIGNKLKSASINCAVLGQYNDTTGFDSINDSNHALLIVGNGAKESARSNALVVTKDGNTKVTGSIYASGNRIPNTFSGTSMPSNTLGQNGDIYIMYEA